MATTLVQEKEKKPYSRNRLVIGLVLVGTGLLILLLFGLNVKAGQHGYVTTDTQGGYAM